MKRRRSDMDTNTGRIIENVMRGPIAPYESGPRLQPIRRELTAREKFDRQIQLYSPCGCGSGKKFKFCCYTGNK
jgi:hypothetical protein